MAQGITELKEFLEGLLNPSVFTVDSLEGVLVILIVIFLVYRLTRHLGDFVGWLIGALFMIQLCYLLGMTAVNDYIPFANFFKYDVITAVAQVFEGTFVCDALLYVSAFMRYIAKVVAGAFEWLWPVVTGMIREVFKYAPWWPEE